MPKRPAWRTDLSRLLTPGLAVAGLVLGLGPAVAQQVPELVDKANLRVCSDPANMPFSNRRQEVHTAVQNSATVAAESSSCGRRKSRPPIYLLQGEQEG